MNIDLKNVIPAEEYAGKCDTHYIPLMQIKTLNECDGLINYS